MPKPRAQRVSLEATAYYHCISRCVRRAFRCGTDRLTGKSFDHRKQWLAERMQELSAIFAIDICAYGLMSNHFHALVTCMSYVDLNPLRAGIAPSLEESPFTSIRERLLAVARGETEAPRLVPFADQAGAGTDPLPLGFADYVEVLRWTAAALTGTRGDAVPAGVGTSLERVGLERTGFLDSVRHYARRFFTMVGHAHRIRVESRRRGYRRRPGMRAAEQLYRATAA
jgi:hypothetical protein